MKRIDLISLLLQHGFELHRNGSNHDIYKKGSQMIPVPRHKEIVETTAKRILKEAGTFLSVDEEGNYVRKQSISGVPFKN